MREFEDESYRGFSVIKKGVEFTNGLSALPDGFQQDNPNNYFKREVGLLYTTYKICLVPDFKNALKIKTSGNTYSTGLYTSSEGTPNFDLIIRLPQKAYRHNADKVVNDKIYQWNFASESDNEQRFIMLEYKKLDLSILAGIISLILIIGGAFYIKQKNDNSDVVRGL